MALAGDGARFKEALKRAKAMTKGEEVPEETGGLTSFDQIMADIVNGSQIDTEVVDLDELEGLDPPEVDWVVKDMLPRGTVTLLTGKGRVGKSTWSLQLAECMRCGSSFLGHATIGRTTLIYSCEDDLNEVHRRHQRIRRGLAAVAGGSCREFGKTFIWPRVGQFNDLVELNPRTGSLAVTPAFRSLAHEAIKRKVDLIVIDTLAQTFAGSENDRTIVTKYLNMLARLAKICRACVLVLAHPPKSDAEYSGSTGWDGTVRTRMLLHRVERDGEQHHHFKIAKVNYCPEYDKEVFRNSTGILFSPEELPPEMAAVREAPEDLSEPKRIFLMLLDERIGSQLTLSCSRNATNYAPRVFAEDLRATGITQQRFEKAMNELLRDQVLVPRGELPWKIHRSKVYGLARSIGQNVECTFTADDVLAA